jgi:hypothetical protein
LGVAEGERPSTCVPSVPTRKPASNRGGDSDSKVYGALKAAGNRRRAAVDSAPLVDEDVDLRRLVVDAAR